MRQEERDTYIIPPNFIEGGTLMGGMVRTRNAVEAGLLGALTALPVLRLDLSLTARIIILCLTTLPLVLVALIGINGESLSAFAVQLVNYLRNRRVLDQSGTGSRKSLLPSWAQKGQPADPKAEELPKSRRRFQVDIKGRKVSQHKTFLESEEKVRPLNPLADYVPIEKIIHGVIKTRDHRYIKVVEVVPVNFLLRSAQEQRSIIYSFISYLKIAPEKVQFKVLTKRADIDRHVEGVRQELARETNPHCRMLQEDYLRLIRDLGSREAITRRFFLIFEHEPLPGTKRGQEEDEAIASLQTAARTAANYLRQCGNTVLMPEDQNEAAAEVLYHILCRRESNEYPFTDKAKRVVAEYLGAGREPDNIPTNEFYSPAEIDFTHGRYICIDGVYYAYLLVPSDGFKAQVPAGWLSLLVNAGDGIDLDVFLTRQPKDRMIRKLGQQLRINRSKIRETSDTNTDFDDLDGAIRSGYFLKDGLGNNEDFYYLNLLVTVTAGSVDELEWKCAEMKKLLLSQDMNVQPCSFCEEQAFLSSLPLASLEKHLFERSKRNVLTLGAASCYPFTSYEMCDDNSVTSGSSSTGSNVGGSSNGNGLTFENDPTVTLTIHKYIEGTANEPLAGVAFKVVDGSGAAVGSSDGVFYTNAAGEIVINGLEPGTVITAREIKTVDGFVLDGTPKTVKITAGSQAPELTFWNQRAGELVIRKLDSVTKKPLAGVEFELTYAGGGFVDTANGHLSSNGLYTTDANGEIRISGVTGTIVVRETRTISGYIIDEATRTQTVEVHPDDTQVLTFYNTPQQVLVIQKYVDGTTVPIQGVTFLVTDSSGAVVGPNNGEYVTDRNGRIVLTNLTPGTAITVRETKTVDGYVLDTTPQSILIKSGAAQTMTFFNKAEGGLELIKVNGADRTQRIPSVTFEIRRMDGGLVETVTTDKNGRVYAALDAGDYYAVEIQAAEGFKLDATPHYFTIRDGKTTTLTVTNRPYSGILIHKVDSVTGEGINGVKFLVYDQNKNPIGEYSTDNEGYIYVDDLMVQGKLFIRELEAAPGYELDKEYKTVYLQPGKTVEIEWQNTPITGQFQICKYAAEYNEVTGTPAGAPLQGAVYEISEARSGKVVDYIVTDARGVAASKPLPLGRYKITEVTAPAYWQLSGTVFDETLEYSGQIIKLSDYDKPVTLGVGITKRGNYQVLAGSQMRYDFTVANTSSVALENFFWHDRIPTDVTRATVFTTGTYSARLNYRILYKTNYSASYQVLASNLLTTNNYSFSLNAIPMQAGEYVTDIYLDFGKVPVGFQSTGKPTLTVQVFGTVANGYQIINRADVSGKYQSAWQTAQASWVTIVRKLTTTPTLPKTGY